MQGRYEDITEVELMLTEPSQVVRSARTRSLRPHH